MESKDIRIEYSKRRTVVLSMQPDGTLVVKAPLRTPKIFINAFVRKNAEWIEKQRERLKKRSPYKKTVYKNGEIFLYLGKEFRLTIGDYAAIEVKDCMILYPKFLEFRIQKELEAWFRKEGERLITEQVKELAPQMDANYKGISFADTKSKWGHCTLDNFLQFNWRLIMAPILVLNYVVVHELTHTTEKHHQRKFWKKVSHFNPSYRQQIKWLKENGDRLNQFFES